jgi:hypothetical protein
MSPPPENERARLATVGHAQFDNLVPDNGIAPVPAQERESIQVVWTREARRLAGQFSLTGDWRHFRALVRHVAGMALRFRIRTASDQIERRRS